MCSRNRWQFPKLCRRLLVVADLRKLGTVPHAGFGLGFEAHNVPQRRENIRDVIPFARTPGNDEFK